MKAKQLLFLFSALVIANAVNAQDYNPYKDIGKKGKVLTLSKGKYVEFFDMDTVQRIGTVMYNIRTKKIVKLLNAATVYKKASNNTSSSRWYSVDPLSDKGKNISYSPYTYTVNNPINYIDPDGLDGIRIIDMKNKTITIKAVYFVQSEKRSYVVGKKVKKTDGYSSSQIKDMQTSNNQYLNDLKMTVSEGDYNGFAVKFDLQFKAGGNINSIEAKAREEKEDGVIIGNSISKANEKAKPRFREVETVDEDKAITNSHVGGYTELNKFITMNTIGDSKMNRIHEIFHTLGLSHLLEAASSGVMKYPPETPNQKDINNISNGSFLPKKIINQ